MPPPPKSTPFPYTTLFRSQHTASHLHAGDLSFGIGTTRIDKEGKALRCRDRLVQQFEPLWLKLNAQVEIGRAQSELQSHSDLVCRLLLEKKKQKDIN